MKIYRRPLGKRGVYFVSSLVVAVLVSMLVLSALYLSRDTLRASRHLTTGDSALKAAKSGLRYAQSKLGANPSWRGDDNGRTVEQDGLVIEETDGNVIGILKAPDGTYSQFRIRFNWQDDSGAKSDPFDDPPAGARIDHPFVSVNNVAGGSPMEVPRGDGTNYSVTNSSERPYSVPPGAVCILVEGRSGGGLSALGPGNLNPAPSGGQVSSRLVEAYLEVANRPGANAAAMAAGNVEVTLQDNGTKVKVDSKSGVPRVRSKKQVKVEGGDSSRNYESKEGEVHSKDGSLEARYNDVTTQVEDADASFYKLSWDEVKKAEATDTTISAGTYVLWDDKTLHYYDMDYTDYVAFIRDNPEHPGTIVDLDSESLKHDGTKLTVKGNVLVESTSNSDEFNFIPRKGAQEDPEGAGGGGGGDYQEQRENLITSVLPGLPSTYSTTPTYHVTWRVPLTTAVPGGRLQVVHPPGGTDGWGGSLTLTDNGDGTGSLVLDDNNGLDLSPRLNTNPVGALKRALDIADYRALSGVEDVVFTLAGAGGGGGMNEIALPETVPAELSADDLEVEFKPKGGGSAILSAKGNVNIGSKVKGQGGSITSEGNIRIVGAGSDLSANIEEGLNMYAKGDITLSSLLPKDNGEYEYKDFKMKGVIYTWGDFAAKIGHDDEDVKSSGKFSLQGALVAYGNKNRAELANAPGQGDGGAIKIRAKEVELTFDAAYLSAIQTQPEPGVMTQTFFTVHK